MIRYYIFFQNGYRCYQKKICTLICRTFVCTYHYYHWSHWYHLSLENGCFAFLSLLYSIASKLRCQRRVHCYRDLDKRTTQDQHRFCNKMKSGFCFRSACLALIQKCVRKLARWCDHFSQLYSDHTKSNHGEGRASHSVAESEEETLIRIYSLTRRT